MYELNIKKTDGPVDRPFRVSFALQIEFPEDLAQITQVFLGYGDFHPELFVEYDTGSVGVDPQLRTIGSASAEVVCRAVVSLVPASRSGHGISFRFICLKVHSALYQTIHSCQYKKRPNGRFLYIPHSTYA